MRYTPAADQLAPFKEAVRKADKAYREASSFERLNIARSLYCQAVEDLREAEYRLAPEACDRHYLTAC